MVVPSFPIQLVIFFDRRGLRKLIRVEASGNDIDSWGKSPFFMGKSTIPMVMFNNVGIAIS